MLVLGFREVGRLRNTTQRELPFVPVDALPPVMSACQSQPSVVVVVVVIPVGTVHGCCLRLCLTRHQRQQLSVC